MTGLCPSAVGVIAVWSWGADGSFCNTVKCLTKEFENLVSGQIVGRCRVIVQYCKCLTKEFEDLVAGQIAWRPLEAALIILEPVHSIPANILHTREN